MLLRIPRLSWQFSCQRLVAEAEHGQGSFLLLWPCSGRSLSRGRCSHEWWFYLTPALARWSGSWVSKCFHVRELVKGGCLLSRPVLPHVVATSHSGYLNGLEFNKTPDNWLMLATFLATCGDYFGEFPSHTFLLSRASLDCICDI